VRRNSADFFGKRRGGSARSSRGAERSDGERRCNEVETPPTPFEAIEAAQLELDLPGFSESRGHHDTASSFQRSPDLYTLGAWQMLLGGAAMAFQQ
jgi:hypothetical protein